MIQFSQKITASLFKALKLTMILVLLTRFSESEDSIFGYKLCQVLAEQGHELYVTSVSTGKALE